MFFSLKIMGVTRGGSRGSQDPNLNIEIFLCKLEIGKIDYNAQIIAY